MLSEKPNAASTVDWPASLIKRSVARALKTDWQLQWKNHPTPLKALDILAVDCSASMVESGALALAKGVALALIERAYQARRHAALIAFCGHEARLEIAPQQASWNNDVWVTSLQGGGGTPLHAALECVQDLLHHQNSYTRQNSYAHRTLWLLSDARVNHWPSRPAGCDAIYILDFESGPLHLRIGNARAIARDWRAQYLG
ncbi:magnesium chelatase, subunit ChlD [gamma proteobacterium HdN1]|nr:magnesium chelatase, subunit ChlD [gamma proteobacterium HdN1]